MSMPCDPFPHIDLCIDQHGDKRFFIETTDQDNVPLDLSAFSEITFIISANVNSAILLSKTQDTDLQRTFLDCSFVITSFPFSTLPTVPCYELLPVIYYFIKEDQQI